MTTWDAGGNRDPQIWNMAIDYIVNWTLKNNDIGEQPKNTLYSEKYNDEWSSDAVYNDLIKNSVQIEMPFDHHLDFSGKDDDDDKKKGGGSGDKNEDGEDGDNDGDGGGSGDKDGKMRVTVVNDGTDGPVKVTEEDLQKIRNEIKSAVINAAQSVGAGKVPAGVRRMIEELTEPKMDWRELLQTHIKSSIVDDFTYQRVNRRSWNMDFILPGMNVMDTIDVCIAVDVSGSIGDDQIRDFLSEIKGIMETFMDFKIRIWSFDTDVYSYREFGPETMEELLSWEPKGGGGTDFMVNWDYMKKNDIEPERFVMFTDGYPYDSWGDPEYCEALFIIHGNPDGEAPFGMTAHYEDPDNRT